MSALHLLAPSAGIVGSCLKGTASHGRNLRERHLATAIATFAIAARSAHIEPVGKETSPCKYLSAGLYTCHKLPRRLSTAGVTVDATCKTSLACQHRTTRT